MFLHESFKEGGGEKLWSLYTEGLSCSLRASTQVSISQVQMSLEARLSFHPIIFHLSLALPLSFSKVNGSTEGHSLLQVGDWTFVISLSGEDGWEDVVTVSRESDKILVDGAARCD